MSNYKKRNLTAGQNYSVAPEIILFSGNATINITATGYGLTVGPTGTRWYNTALLPNGILSGVNSQNTSLPFSNANVPAALYDAICRVDIGSEKFVYATSNSPDNQVVTAANTNKEVFWLDLQAYRAGSAGGGDNNSPNDFMAFGTSIVDNATNNAASIRFLNPTPIATTCNWVIEQFGAGATITQTGILPIPAGVTSVQILSNNYFLLQLPFSTNIRIAGHYRIQLTMADPSYQSMLNYYHYGGLAK